MSTRLATMLAVLAAAAIAAFAGAAPSRASVSGYDGGPAYLDPDAASGLLVGDGGGGLSAATQVDGATALAAASAPGAMTSVDPDLSPAEAVGLTSDSTKWCWADKAWHQWGVWPYEQKLTQTTYWCAQYGVKVTYQSTNVTAGGTICGADYRTSQIIAGGVGFPFFTTRSTAGFACDTDIPWVTLHTTHHVDVRRDDKGGAAIVATG